MIDKLYSCDTSDGKLMVVPFEVEAIKSKIAQQKNNDPLMRFHILMRASLSSAHFDEGTLYSAGASNLPGDLEFNNGLGVCGNYFSDYYVTEILKNYESEALAAKYAIPDYMRGKMLDARWFYMDKKAVEKIVGSASLEHYLKPLLK